MEFPFREQTLSGLNCYRCIINNNLGYMLRIFKIHRLSPNTLHRPAATENVKKFMANDYCYRKRRHDV